VSGLAETGAQISGTARVIWSDSTGRVGLAFQALTELRAALFAEWLSLTRCWSRQCSSALLLPSSERRACGIRPNYTYTSPAASAVQREADVSWTDLEAFFPYCFPGAISAARFWRGDRSDRKR